MKRVGVDVGGTFTDLIYLDDESGKTLIHKLPTTPADPSEGTVNGVVDRPRRSKERECIEQHSGAGRQRIERTVERRNEAAMTLRHRRVGRHQTVEPLPELVGERLE